MPLHELPPNPDEIPTDRLVEDGRRIRARQRKAETHRLLVAAAARAFGEAGYLATTLDQIIGYAGVTRGTFYEHFQSKAEAFGAVLDDLVARLTQAVVGVDLEPDAPPPQIQLAGNLLRVLDILLSDRAVARLLLVEAGQEPAVGSKVTALHAFARGMIRQALLDGAPVGLVRPLQAEVAAHALLGAVLAVMAARLDGETGLDDLPEQTLARELLTTCLCGVAGEELRLAILGMEGAARAE